MNANHKNADLWIQVRDKVNAHHEQNLRHRVAWVRPHTTAREKAHMRQKNEQMAMVNDKADDLAGERGG